MHSKLNRAFDVVVEATKKGNATTYWSHKTIAVQSQWNRGSEQEKFEVLDAIRKIYNPEERTDIRGTTRQTPDQIGQSEGFTQLQYCHAEFPLGSITVIVKGIASYRRVLPLTESIPKAPLLPAKAC